MNDPRLDFEVRRYKAIRDALLADNADDIDEQTLADTTEGLTDLHELLAAIVRGSLNDDRQVGLLKSHIFDLQRRIETYQRREEHRRDIVRKAMEDTGIKKISAPDFTVSLRPGAPHVVVIDEKLIPATFWEQVPRLRKRELGNALKDGTPVEGATLSNPGMTLSVRTR
jgi:hypothetical protein